MPLPPALLARLQKRGIVPKEEKQPSTPVGPAAGQEPVEEVFAEDYDDPVKEATIHLPPSEVSHQGEEELPSSTHGPVVLEVTACVNKSNPYHVCLAYCKERYGMLTFRPDPNMLKKRDRMLQKYPLPEQWMEVGDPQTNRYFYWNVLTDDVTWLSPLHPKANITRATEKQKYDLSSGLVGDGYGSDDEVQNDSDESLSSSSSSSESEDETERKRKHKGGGRGGRRSYIGQKRGRKMRDEIDPMDPASYSDVGRGTWSTGLDRSGEAKTGVDTTASGPLFQQRPYPSPGEILRRNNAGK